VAKKYGDTNNPTKDALWFSLPDVAASVLLTGRVPKVIDAFRIKPAGKLPGLTPTKLRNTVGIAPRNQDFFKVAIEERKRLSSRSDLGESEKDRLDKALKVLANAASYGIYAEMIREESEEKVKVTCHGIDADPFVCRVAHPDVPGEYCFPPLAALITGAARLMLALLEDSVRKFGGTYAMEDTDSMAIVATEHGGTVPCAGGVVGDKCNVIKAISWEQVQTISDDFAALNPYDRSAVPGSILKIEDDNFDPTTGHQREIRCFAISAKRYALFVKDKSGTPVLLRGGLNNRVDQWSEHGLGHLLNPTDPESEDRNWIGLAWRNIVSKASRLPVDGHGFPNSPAVGRIGVSSPAVMRPLLKLNHGKNYAGQIKPFNFLLTSHVRPLGQPTGSDPENFHLIAPYELDPRRWVKMNWIDQYSGKIYRIATAGDYGTRQTARVKTYAETLEEYEFHPEAKCADADGNACEKQTIGLLQRRHIRIEQIKYIGKESNVERHRRLLLRSGQRHHRRKARSLRRNSLRPMQGRKQLWRSHLDLPICPGERFLLDRPSISSTRRPAARYRRSGYRYVRDLSCSRGCGGL